MLATEDTYLRRYYAGLIGVRSLWCALAGASARYQYNGASRKILNDYGQRFTIRCVLSIRVSLLDPGVPLAPLLFCRTLAAQEEVPLLEPRALLSS